MIVKTTTKTAVKDTFAKNKHRYQQVPTACQVDIRKQNKNNFLITLKALKLIARKVNFVPTIPRKSLMRELLASYFLSSESNIGSSKYQKHQLKCHNSFYQKFSRGFGVLGFWGFGV